MDGSLHIPGGSGVEDSCLGQEGRRSRDKLSGHSAGSQAQRWEGLWHMQGVLLCVLGRP